ncbi:ATP synthase subunit alpha OS=Stutzerimonas stutzeri OX=316 GN=atpA PE=3 SV=1 [Stutzerimonas stutzeri]
MEQFTKGAVTGKTGSLTALPIIETQAGNVRVDPTNVVLDRRATICSWSRPCSTRVSVRRSTPVSRYRVWVVRRRPRSSRSCPAASVPLWPSIVNWRRSRSSLSDLDEATRKQLEHGQRVTELMKQKQYAPMSIADMSLSLYAAERGYLADVEVAKVGAFEQALIAFFNREFADLMAKINVKGDFNDEIDAGLKAGIEKFKATQSW